MVIDKMKYKNIVVIGLVAIGVLLSFGWLNFSQARVVIEDDLAEEEFHKDFEVDESGMSYFYGQEDEQDDKTVKLIIFLSSPKLAWWLLLVFNMLAIVCLYLLLIIVIALLSMRR